MVIIMKFHLKEIEFSKIEIPIVPLEENDTQKFINIKKYLCCMIESFDYYHHLKVMLML